MCCVHTVDYRSFTTSQLVRTQSTFRPHVLQRWSHNTSQTREEETLLVNRLNGGRNLVDGGAEQLYGGTSLE